MNGSQVTSIGVALACILAFGVASTTLESTVATDPADVISVSPDYSVVPGASAGDIRKQIESNQGNPEEMPESQAADGSNDGPSSSGDQMESSGQQGEGPGQGSGDTSLSWLDRLLAFLAQLVALLPYLVLALGLVAAYRNRDRLFRILADQQVVPTRPTTDSDPWAGVHPPDIVEQAWIEMVRRVEVDNPRTKTPAECASAARAAEMDPEGVMLITRAFRRARYANGLSTEEQREMARRGLDRLGFGSGDH